ncbi:MAG: manganese efflux pump [Candidatus Malihini olakiniferum]
MCFFASQHILEWYYWITSTPLVILGRWMIMEVMRTSHDNDEPISHHTLFALICIAIAIAFMRWLSAWPNVLQVNIFHAVIVIGCATMIMATMIIVALGCVLLG